MNKLSDLFTRLNVPQVNVVVNTFHRTEPTLPPPSTSKKDALIHRLFSMSKEKEDPLAYYLQHYPWLVDPFGKTTALKVAIRFREEQFVHALMDVGALTYAIELGYMDMVETLVKRGADVNERIEHNVNVQYKGKLKSKCTPLTFAVCLGNDDMVEKLLSLGADPNDRVLYAPNENETYVVNAYLLSYLIRKTFTRERMVSLLRSKTDLHTLESCGFLHCFMYHSPGDLLSICKSIPKDGLGWAWNSTDGLRAYTPFQNLCIECSCWSTELSDEVIRTGADPLKKTYMDTSVVFHLRAPVLRHLLRYDQFPLWNSQLPNEIPLLEHILSSTFPIDIVELLVMKHALHRLKFTQFKVHPLLRIVEHPSATNIVKRVCETLGEVTSIVDENGNNLLHIATTHGCSETVLYLLRDVGFNPNVMNKCGQTPLHLFYHRHHTGSSSRYLLDYGANPELLCHAGESPFLLALDCNDLVFFQRCITAGFKQDYDEILNRYLNSNQRMDHETIRFLVALHNREDMNVKFTKIGTMIDKDGRTLLHCACATRNEGFVRDVLATKQALPYTRDKKGRTPLAMWPYCPNDLFLTLVREGAYISRWYPGDDQTFVNINRNRRRYLRTIQIQYELLMFTDLPPDVVRSLRTTYLS